MTTIDVRPAPGRRVRMPDRDFAVMPDSGAVVPDIPFYRQRLADCDLVLATAAPAAPADPAPARKAKS